MKKRFAHILCICLLLSTLLPPQKVKSHEVKSADGNIVVSVEEANFNFSDDYRSFIRIQWDYRDGKMFNSSFEALYHEIRLSQFPKDSLAFLPLLVEAGRMMACPMDYTPGTMRNTTEAAYRVVPNNPMAKGTRCNQLAMYVIFEAPHQMLSDNPTIYKREEECTNFITKVPTTFDETVPLDGKIGEFVALARRKGDTWFVSAMSNRTPHDLTLDFSFLHEGTYEAEIFKDSMNADREATDYKREIIFVSKSTKRPVKLYPGGGLAALIYKK